MSIIELVTKLSNAKTIHKAATIAIDSKLAGAKDIYLAWGKEKGWKVADLNSAWKAASPQRATSGATGFAAQYYDWLAEDSRTEEEAYSFIMDGTTKNVQNHLTHYLNIWALAQTVREGRKVIRTISAKKAKAEPQPEPEVDEQSDAIKKAWADLRKFAQNPPKTKRGYNKVRPDKVSHLGDDELTKAYTEMYQKAPK